MVNRFFKRVKRVRNRRVKFKWVLRGALIAAALAVLITSCLIGRETMVELSERERIEEVMTSAEGYNLRRRFYDPAGKTVYATYWDHCGATMTAGHVHVEMDSTPPQNALGRTRYKPGACLLYTSPSPRDRG